jgi:hypothetical protein
MHRVEPKVANNTKRERASKARLVLIDGDVAIFKLVYEYRLLRRDHLSALTGRPLKRLHRRLLQLVKAAYLTTIKLPQQRHIYALGRLSVPVLVEQGIADPALLGDRLRTHELKELFLKHEMMIVDLHVTLELATRGNPVGLVAWREGRELHDYVRIADGHSESRLPIRPDALFTLEDSRRSSGHNRVHFVLEADRSTENHARFRDKIRGYFHYIEQGLHVKKFDIQNFRVLTVATTQERARNLVAMTRTLLPERGWKYFFFSSLKNFKVENPAPILEAVHLSPRDNGEEHWPLVPAPGAAAKAI